MTVGGGECFVMFTGRCSGAAQPTRKQAEVSSIKAFIKPSEVILNLFKLEQFAPEIKGGDQSSARNYPYPNSPR